MYSVIASIHQLNEGEPELSYCTESAFIKRPFLVAVHDSRNSFVGLTKDSLAYVGNSSDTHEIPFNSPNILRSRGLSSVPFNFRLRSREGLHSLGYF